MITEKDFNISSIALIERYGGIAQGRTVGCEGGKMIPCLCGDRKSSVQTKQAIPEAPMMGGCDVYRGSCHIRRAI